MDNAGVWLALLLKPFIAVVIVGGIFLIGDWFVPRLERFWPIWLGRRALFKRYGDSKRQ